MMRALPRPVLWLAVLAVLALSLISALAQYAGDRAGMYVQPLLRVNQGAAHQLAWHDSRN